MKSLTILLALAIICSSSISQQSDSSTNNPDLFEVLSIEDKESFYLVILKKDDLLYKLCNDKTKRNKRNCTKIKEGGVYHFELQKIYPLDTLFAMLTIPNLKIVTDYHGYTLTQDEKYHYKVYTATNMNGLWLKKQCNTPQKKPTTAPIK